CVPEREQYRIGIHGDELCCRDAVRQSSRQGTRPGTEVDDHGGGVVAGSVLDHVRNNREPFLPVGDIALLLGVPPPHPSIRILWIKVSLSRHRHPRLSVVVVGHIVVTTTKPRWGSPVNRPTSFTVICSR